jgi:hypothetical protein
VFPASGRLFNDNLTTSGACIFNISSYEISGFSLTVFLRASLMDYLVLCFVGSASQVNSTVYWPKEEKTKIEIKTVYF